MWHLNINDKFVSQYVGRILSKLVNKVNNSNLSYIHKNVLNNETLKDLLELKPEDMERYNIRLMEQLVDGFSKDNWDRYLKGETNEAYYTQLKKLYEIFDYDGLISKNKQFSYWIANSIGQNTCTYCNRQYTFTITSDEQKIARPTFDHWYPKEFFPLLSLSIYNLIPCCTICNSSVKGREIFSMDTHIHPYTETKPEPDFKFIPCLNPEDEHGWSVYLKRGKTSQKVENMIKSFALDEIYSCHGNLEVKDLIEFANAYPDSYLKSLFKNVLKDLTLKGMSQEDAYRLLFSTEFEPVNYLKRPLSKLKKDILEYLGIII